MLIGDWYLALRARRNDTAAEAVQRDWIDILRRLGRHSTMSSRCRINPDRLPLLPKLRLVQLGPRHINSARQPAPRHQVGVRPSLVHQAPLVH